MTLQTQKKTSDLEKRLKILRQQVYGKQEFKTDNTSTTNYQPQTANLSTDITYLYKDLSKIAVLSSIALGIQLILFFLSQNHLLNLYLR